MLNPKSLLRGSSDPASKENTRASATSVPGVSDAVDQKIDMLLKGPQKITRSITQPNARFYKKHYAMEELDNIVTSLRESAHEFSNLPKKGFFNVEFIGCQHQVLDTPLYFLLHHDVYVEELRSLLKTRLKYLKDEHIIMLYAGWFLKNGRKLGDYGIMDHSQIVVVLQENIEEEKELTREEKANRPNLMDHDIQAPVPQPNTKNYKKRDESGINTALFRIMRDSLAQPQEMHSKKKEKKENEEKAINENNENQVKQREQTEDLDMITLETDPDEPRYKMPCGHSITPASLIAFVQHELSENQTTILCPSLSEDSRCNRMWFWPDIRFVAEPTNEICKKIETMWSFNVVAKALNAQKCEDCGAILYRDKKGLIVGYKASCPNCARLANPHLGEKHFCWGCRIEWSDPNQLACKNGHCPANFSSKVLEILQNSELKKIGSVENVPSVRACIYCGQLITHWTSCKHMQCYICKQSFCFVCLKGYIKDVGWQCGSSGDVCDIAPVQEQDIFQFSRKNILNLNREIIDETAERNLWTSGAQVEVYQPDSNTWIPANIVDIFQDDHSEICDVVFNDNPDIHMKFNRMGHHIRPFKIRQARVEVLAELQPEPEPEPELQPESQPPQPR